ncbi:hypothetical protein [Glaciihabitans arcticus]|nr:hypothetical protein [Glaciihabitans arcticus]
MTLHKDRKPDVWRTPWKNRTTIIVVSVAVVIVVGALIASLFLDIDLI